MQKTQQKVKGNESGWRPNYCILPRCEQAIKLCLIKFLRFWLYKKITAYNLTWLSRPIITRVLMKITNDKTQYRACLIRKIQQMLFVYFPSFIFTPSIKKKMSISLPAHFYIFLITEMKTVLSLYWIKNTIYFLSQSVEVVHSINFFSFFLKLSFSSGSPLPKNMLLFHILIRNITSSLLYH